MTDRLADSTTVGAIAARASRELVIEALQRSKTLPGLLPGDRVSAAELR